MQALGVTPLISTPSVVQYQMPQHAVPMQVIQSNLPQLPPGNGFEVIQSNLPQLPPGNGFEVIQSNLPQLPPGNGFANNCLTSFATSTPQNGGPVLLYCCRIPHPPVQNFNHQQPHHNVMLTPPLTAPVTHNYPTTHQPSYFEGLMSDSTRPCNLSYLSDLNDSATLSVSHPSLNITPNSYNTSLSISPAATVGWSCESHRYSAMTRNSTANMSTASCLLQDNGSTSSGVRKRLFSSSTLQCVSEDGNAHGQNISDVFSYQQQLQQEGIGLLKSESPDCYIISPDIEKQILVTSTPFVDIQAGIKTVHTTTPNRKQQLHDNIKQQQFSTMNVLQQSPNSTSTGMSLKIGMKLPLNSTPSAKIKIQVTPVDTVFQVTPVTRPEMGKAHRCNNTFSEMSPGYLTPEDCIDLTSDIREDELSESTSQKLPVQKRDVAVQSDVTSVNQCSCVSDNTGQLQPLDHSCRSPTKDAGFSTDNTSDITTTTSVSSDKSTMTRSISHDTLSTFSTRSDTTRPHTKRCYCYNDSDSTIEYTTGYHSNSPRDSTSPWQQRRERLFSSFTKQQATQRVTEKLMSPSKVTQVGKPSRPYICLPAVSTAGQHTKQVVTQQRVEHTKEIFSHKVTAETVSSSLSNVKVKVDHSKIMSRHFVPISTHATTPTKAVRPVAKYSFVSSNKMVVAGSEVLSDSEHTSAVESKLITNVRHLETDMLIKGADFPQNTSELSTKNTSLSAKDSSLSVKDCDLSNTNSKEIFLGTVTSVDETTIIKDGGNKQVQQDNSLTSKNLSVNMNNCSDVQDITSETMNEITSENMTNELKTVITSCNINHPEIDNINNDITNQTDCDIDVIAKSLILLKENPRVKPGSNCSDSPLDLSFSGSTLKTTDLKQISQSAVESSLTDVETPSRLASGSTPPNSRKQGRALERLLTEAEGMNGCNKKKTPRCLKCYRWFRTHSLLAEHYQVHNIVPIRRGQLTLYGPSHYVHRHASTSPTSSGTDCIACSPPPVSVIKKKKRRSTSVTPLSRYQATRSTQPQKPTYTLRYTPSTSTDDTEKNSSHSRKRKLNFNDGCSKPRKSMRTACSVEAGLLSSENLRVLRLRKRIIEVFDGKKTTFIPTTKTAATDSATQPLKLKTVNLDKPSNKRRFSKHILAPGSPLKKRLSKIPVRYTAKLMPKTGRDYKLRSNKTPIRYTPKMNATSSKALLGSKKMYRAKAVVSKLPVPFTKKDCNVVKRSVTPNIVKRCKSPLRLATKARSTSSVPSASKKTLSAKRLSMKYESKQLNRSRNNGTKPRKSNKQVSKPISSSDTVAKCKDVRQTRDKTVTIKHSGENTNNKRVKSALKKLNNKKPTDISNHATDCKSNKPSTVIKTEHSVENEDLNNNNRLDDKADPLSPIMPAPNKSFVEAEDVDLDFEAALLEMQIVNDGLPPFITDSKYMDSLKQKTQGKTLPDCSASAQKKKSKNDSTSIKKKKIKSSGYKSVKTDINSKSTKSKLDKKHKNSKKQQTVCKDTAVVSTTGSVLINTNTQGSDISVPSKFKLVWNQPSSDGEKNKKGRTQSESSTESISSSCSQQGAKQTAAGNDKRQRDPLALDKCRYCAAVMPRCELPGHRMALHRFSCNVCKSRFSTKEERVSHQKTHTFFHECQLCDKKFGNAQNFKRHLSTKDHIRLEKVQRHTMDYMYSKFMADKEMNQTSSDKNTVQVPVAQHSQNSAEFPSNPPIEYEQAPVVSSYPITSQHAPAMSDPILSQQASVVSYPRTSQQAPACGGITFNDGFLNELGINEPEQCTDTDRIDYFWEISSPPCDLPTNPADAFPVENAIPYMAVPENQFSQDYTGYGSDQIFNSGLGTTGEQSFNASSRIRTALNLVDLFGAQDEMTERNFLAL